MSPKAKQIISEIKKLTDELTDLQNNCDHKNKVIKYSEEEKAVIKECQDCNHMCGYPTQTELLENGFKK